MNKKEWSKFKTEFYGRNLRHLRFIKKYAPMEIANIQSIKSQLNKMKDDFKAQQTKLYSNADKSDGALQLFDADKYYNYYMPPADAIRHSNFYENAADTAIIHKQIELDNAILGAYSMAGDFRKVYRANNNIPKTCISKRVIKPVLWTIAGYSLFTTIIFFGANDTLIASEKCNENGRYSAKIGLKYPRIHTAGAEFLWEKATNIANKFLPNNNEIQK